MSGEKSNDYQDVSSRKMRRRLAAFARLNKLMGTPGISPEKMTKMEAEAISLHDRINGIRKKPTKKTESASQDKSKDYLIDIYSVSHSSIKRSERRKNKGKSRKGLKRVKNVSLLKTVQAKDGLITAYKDGKMGLSPKHHVFKVRKKEISIL